MAEDWDDAAATFDDEPDHGLRHPEVRAAWESLLLPLMPDPPARILDLGCGTGSLAVLLAEAGHEVSGLDLSDRMIDVARTKSAAAGVDVDLCQGDAADPPYPPASADVVLSRHVLWALPDRDDVLARWVRLLGPGGRLVLVEGRWGTGVGLAAADCRALVLRHRAQATVRQLGPDSALWGKSVDDERYVVVSER
jgi:ubiquinone/menaquinone biosynthesis C-methylase UbiE